MKSISGNVSTSKFDAKEIESQSLKINLISSKFESQGDEFAKVIDFQLILIVLNIRNDQKQDFNLNIGGKSQDFK